MAEPGTVVGLTGKPRLPTGLEQRPFAAAVSQQAAGDLSRLAGDLQNLVAGFRHQVPAPR